MIDETTGMPELPEGMAWKVEEVDRYSGNTLKVSLCVREMREMEVGETERVTRKHWFSKPRTEVLTICEEVEIWVPKYSKELRDVIEVNPEDDVPEDYRPLWPVTSRDYVRYLDPTPENVRKTAEEIWEKYDSVNRAAQQRKALVGMYPPKKLGGK